MAKYLYRLGIWAVENRKKVIFSTLAILIVLVVLMFKMGSSFNDNLTIPNTPADKAQKVLQQAFNTTKQSGAQVQVVFKAPKNETLDSKKVSTTITNSLNAIKKDPAIKSVASPMQLHDLSKDKKIGYAVVTYKVKAKDVTDASKNKILDQIKKTRNAGIQTELTGDVSFSKSSGGSTEVVGVIIAFIILAFTFTSFLAAGMPIVTAGIGLGIGLLGVDLASNFIKIQSVSTSLASMIGLAVGIDYSLFIINRYKQQLSKGDSVKESVAMAVGTSGSAVVFAGLTVMIGLIGMSVTRIPFLTMMGLSAALSVLTAVLVSIIVLPAFLGLLGKRLSSSKHNRLLQRLSGSHKKHEGSNSWGRFVTKHPLIVADLAILLLATIALPFFHMNLGLPTDGNTKSTQTTERRAYDLQTEGYGQGFHATLVVVAKVDKETKNTQQDIKTITNDLSHLRDVQRVAQAIPSPSGKVYMINVTPKTGPNDPKTKDLVKTIRNKSTQTSYQNNIELMVTGTTAVNIDVVQKLNHALPLFALLIVGLAFVLLMMVFRSLFLPLKAVLGFLLSLAATLGFVVFVVQDGHLLNVFSFPASGPILAFLPILVIGILFGLAMDYEVFLVSRMREEYAHTGHPLKAVLTGLKESGKVVTAAGLIMMSVFVGFMLTPDATIKSIGMSLTFGVLFDAFVVRMALVPAVMTLLGESAWYLPKWLDVILPNIDVEGESIIKSKTTQKEASSLSPSTGGSTFAKRSDRFGLDQAATDLNKEHRLIEKLDAMGTVEQHDLSDGEREDAHQLVVNKIRAIEKQINKLSEEKQILIKALNILNRD